MIRLSDSERTDLMRSLLRRKYSTNGGNGARYVLIEELGNSTGFECNRHADAAVFELWRSDGHGLHGFELKASRADLKKELDNPAKHEALYRYCKSWTLITFDTAVVGTLGLPAHWNWWTVNPDLNDFDVQFRAKKDRSRKPEPWPVDFIASLVRHTAKSDPAAAYVAMVSKEVRRQAKWDAQRHVQWEMEQLRREIRDLKAALEAAKNPEVAA